MPRRFLPLFLSVVISTVSVAVQAPAAHLGSATFDAREHLIWKSIKRNSQFSDVPHLTTARCEAVEQPEAIATPDPLWIRADRIRKVKVSFIIGTDGRVHAPLILESAGPRGDRNVLKTVRTWRYRPGTCNGVPTETEGKIEFSIR